MMHDIGGSGSTALTAAAGLGITMNQTIYPSNDQPQKGFTPWSRLEHWMEEHVPGIFLFPLGWLVALVTLMLLLAVLPPNKFRRLFHGFGSEG